MQVVLEPQYRITVLTSCEMMRRLDHRPVDAEALGRQIHRAAEAKALAHVRETADSGEEAFFFQVVLCDAPVARCLLAHDAHTHITERSTRNGTKIETGSVPASF